MNKIIILLTLLSGLACAQEESMELNSAENEKYKSRYNYHNDNETITCESRNHRQSHCYANTRYGVTFVRQLSNASCDYNWGYDDEGIWVKDGCRAEFSVNQGWDQPGAAENILTCESHSYQRNFCRAYLDGRDVFLLRQLSESNCRNNWGYDRNGVWVTNGCRAEFVVEDRYISNNDIVVCSSRDLQFKSCQADTRGGVEFVKQISRASCNGRWGYDRRSIWVTAGCRAKFRLLPYRNDYGHGNNNQQTITCSSKNRRRQECYANTSRGVSLKTQLSRANCQGNWGYVHNMIWVDNGCRAVFKLKFRGHGNNHNNDGYGNNNYDKDGYGNNNHNNDGYGNNNYPPQNKVVTCSSRDLRRATCPIATGAKVKLKKQISRANCEGNWGYTRRQIWVKNGCRAQFTVFNK